MHMHVVVAMLKDALSVITALATYIMRLVGRLSPRPLQPSM